MGQKEIEIPIPGYLDAVLEELNAIKYKEKGTPCYELNWEFFKIKDQKIRIRTEDEIFVYLEGPKDLLDTIQRKLNKMIEQNEVS